MNVIRSEKEREAVGQAATELQGNFREQCRLAGERAFDEAEKRDQEAEQKAREAEGKPPDPEFSYFPTERDREIYEQVDLARRPIADVAAQFELAERTVRNITWLARRALAESRHLLDRRSTTEDLRTLADMLWMREKLAMQSFHESGRERKVKREIDDGKGGPVRVHTTSHPRECDTKHLRESRRAIAQVQGVLAQLRIREAAEDDARVQRTLAETIRQRRAVAQVVLEREEQEAACEADFAPEESCLAEAALLEEQAQALREAAADAKRLREERVAAGRGFYWTSPEDEQEIARRTEAARREANERHWAEVRRQNEERDAAAGAAGEAAGGPTGHVHESWHERVNVGRVVNVPEPSIEQEPLAAASVGEERVPAVGEQGTIGSGDSPSEAPTEDARHLAMPGVGQVKNVPKALDGIPLQVKQGPLISRTRPEDRGRMPWDPEPAGRQREAAERNVQPAYAGRSPEEDGTNPARAASIAPR